MTLKTIICALLASTILVLAPSHASASTWPTKRYVCVEANLSTYWGISNAIRQWNGVEAGQPKFYWAASCPWDYSVRITTVYRPDWHGGTSQATTVAGETIRVKIVLNTAAGRHLSSSNLNAWRRLASVHELGHALGLHHSYVNDSVMCYCTEYWENNGVLHWTDKRALHRLY